MTLAEEFQSRNFSQYPCILSAVSLLTSTAKGIYGQWIGIICMILCFALGIANIFHFGLVVIFSIICLYVFITATTSMPGSNPLYYDTS